MAKDLADREQPGTLAQELNCQRMSQPVRPHPRQTGPHAGPFDDVADQIRPDRSSWCPAGQKQPSTIARDTAREPVSSQVGDQCLADLRRKREPVLAASLASHEQLTGAPVDISQLQPCDLDGP